MRPPETFVGQPIRNLQTMLRVLAEDDPTHKSLVPDGIYGPETLQAVSVFQRKHALPVTGVTDQNTWDILVQEYEPALIRRTEAAPIYIILDPGQILRKGERSPHLYLVQAMLQVLSDQYESISHPPFTGILDDATVEAVASFQYLSNLPMTGEVDKITWKHLAAQYPLAANLSLTDR